MKTKKHLFRIVVGASAFLFGLGIFTLWRSLPTTAAPSAPPPTPAFDKDYAAKLRESYPPLPTAAPPAPPAPPAPETVEEAETAEFDAEGIYTIAGDAPKGFENFAFVVNNKDYQTEDEDQYGKLIAPEGYAQGEEQDEKPRQFVKISIGSDQIQFETESVKKISYSFSGRFTETRSFINLESEAVEKVLEGRLIKKRNGKKIAEAQAVFGWSMESSCSC